MTTNMILGSIYLVASFFYGLRSLGEGRYLLAAGFAVLFLGFVAMVTAECDRAGRRAEARR